MHLQAKICHTCILGVYKDSPEIVKMHRSLIGHSHKAALIYIDKYGTIALLRPLSPNKMTLVHENYAFECCIVENSDSSDHLPKETGLKRKHSESDQKIAAEHYNQLTRDRESRFSSQIFHLRNLNGCIKQILIQNTLSSLALDSFKVLDLCCGHGGDINKWLNISNYRCEEYVGVDIAHEALNDFILNRLEQHKHKSKVSKLITADMGKDCLSSTALPTYIMKEKAWKNVLPLAEDQVFDVISCQFAMHYMFQSSDRAKHFFNQIQKHLRVGGRFIATTVDSRVFMELLMKHISNDTNLTDLSDDLEISVANEMQDTILQIRIENSCVRRLMLEDSTDLFGLRYNFQLFDQPSSSSAAVDAPEWLVPLPVITDLAAQSKLEAREITNFHEFISSAIEGDMGRRYR